MKKILHLLSRVRLKYRRSSTLLKCVLLCAIVMSTVALLTISAATAAEMHKQEQARHNAAALENERQNLQQGISQSGTVEGVLDIAGDELDYEEPGTVYIDIEQLNP